MPLTKQEEKSLMQTFRETNRKLQKLIDNINDLKVSDFDAETLLSPEEAAKYIGFSTAYVYNKLNKEVPHIKRNRKVLYRKSDLDEWLDKNTVNPV